MKRAVISSYFNCFRYNDRNPFMGFGPKCLSVKFSSSLGLSNARPFPDYSPRKPSVKDTDFVHHISTTVKQRRSEPLRRILKPFEAKFKPDHFIWVLMNIKDDYKLVLDFFNWTRLRRDPSLEALCIVVHIAVASKDLRTAHRLVFEFWEKPHLDVGNSFAEFTERLIYTYKDWGAHPFVFDVFFQVLVEAGWLLEARKLFDKLVNYGVLVSVDSCNLFLARLSNSFDGKKMAIKVFKEYPEGELS
ncbi:hypothetical protein LR48_Vigan511s003200 [Vigna angularis]|uniref:Pentatricopeptide repeat-containing protein n=1 Tax=Phaseolus angularis TaxID=3914 RepID=A0A0L9TDG4_PHAAN|nr:hypothetical protein LR48_Vigan511s003200 [Vigna angularis]